MLYDELVKRLRAAAMMSEALSIFLPHSEWSAVAKLYNEAAEAIEELSKPRWIPVTERLPEFEGAVLCMRKSNVYGVRPYQEILYVDEFGFKNFDDIYLADGVVTHWLLLPQPPKEE